VNAHNDPLVPPHLIPRACDVSDKVTLEVTDGGGHLGFVSGRWPWSPQFWLDTRVPEFLASFFGDKGGPMSGSFRPGSEAKRIGEKVGHVPR
jgi:predicted alpha/beta-fold hydrolase